MDAASVWHRIQHLPPDSALSREREADQPPPRVSPSDGERVDTSDPGAISRMFREAMSG